MNPHSFDLVSLVGHSGHSVQLTLLVLASASVISWALILAKALVFSQVRKANAHFLLCHQSQGLTETFHMLRSRGAVPRSPMARLLMAAMTTQAHQESRANGSTLAIQARFQTELKALQSNLDWLGAIASNAPYVGLLGTVIGVMDAFSGLSGTQGTGISAVAPGISEALITTAVGLLTAIPASVAFNRFHQHIGELSSDMEVFALQLLAQLGE